MKPWSEIGIPGLGSSYTAMLANSDHPFDFYWGRNIDGQYVFRFMGNFPAEIGDEAPVMSGITIKAGIEANRSHITLILETADDAKIFYFLCTSLMEATKKIPIDNDTAAARVIITHLGRWQKLLRTQGSKLLSLNEQMGLFGELMVLKDIFLDNLDAREAVSCWTGPMGDEQDFGYGESLVEVKTVRSTRDREIQISSIAQLDAVSGKLSLAFQTVGVFEDQPPESISLNGIIDLVADKLLDQEADITDQFNLRLAMLGYEQHPEYDKYYFALVTRKIFAVEGDFPRIGSTDIRQGVSKASYSILVEACLPYELEKEEAISRILEGVTTASLTKVAISPKTLIKLDESYELEFKSSLRYCYKALKVEKYIEQAVIKSVAALANTTGGRLVIGVDDNKTALGLTNDYGTLRQQNRDGFELHLSSMLVSVFGEVFTAQNVAATFHKIGNQEICILTIQRSEKLVFIETQTKTGAKTQKLLVRIGNSSREIPPDKIPDYIAERSAF